MLTQRKCARDALGYSSLYLERQVLVYINIDIDILPRAEVPRDLDIVPLPPGPFYIKIEFCFYSAIFQCILNKIRLLLY